MARRCVEWRLPRDSRGIAYQVIGYLCPGCRDAQLGGSYLPVEVAQSAGLATGLAEEAGGAMLWVPGMHRVLVRNPCPGPGIPSWVWNGEDDLVELSPSVLLLEGAGIDETGREVPERHLCHHYVRGGKIQYLSDCAHPLAGQTVELPKFPC